MQQTRAHSRRRTLLLVTLFVTLAVLLRDVISALAMQLLTACLLAVLALPLCRLLEKRLAPGAAAAISLISMALGTVLLVVLLIPPVIRQLEQLTSAVPALVDALQSWWNDLSLWMAARNLDASPLRDGLFRQITEGAGGLISRFVGTLTRLASSLGKTLLAPLLAFYVLRDRRQFALTLVLLIPPAVRPRWMRTLRIIRREMGFYFRGQALLSLAVGGMTALALALLGTPAWLLLGVLMGVMELIPYVGPFLAGVPAVLLSLQNGWMRALWALIAIVAVQQVEAILLSPRLLGNAARMHPMTVLLLVSAGGMAAGALGMLLVIPAAILVRGLLRGAESSIAHTSDQS